MTYTIRATSGGTAAIEYVDVFWFDVPLSQIEIAINAIAARLIADPTATYGWLPSISFHRTSRRHAAD